MYYFFASHYDPSRIGYTLERIFSCGRDFGDVHYTVIESERTTGLKDNGRLVGPRFFLPLVLPRFRLT